ncbi:chloride channel protein [Hoylesella nanceiensis]|jgi:chloride channel|uniref:chloride channel protein n=1 Tax=Hoylesella nanceiensis TaxID=425941 RepID=UPI0036F2488F
MKQSTKDYRISAKEIIMWVHCHVPQRQLILIVAFLIGLCASFAGLVLHWLIEQIQHVLTSRFTTESYNLLYLVFPVVGIFFTSLFIKYVVKDDISHGITRVLYAISSKQSRLKGHNCWSSVLASAITIGFGGSVGAEAPIVLTGSAIGSNLGRFFYMDKKTLMLLVGCGASAAIGGIFKAPIAGMVFTLEVLMVDLSMASIMPILISCVTATCFTYIFRGGESMFSFALDSAWSVDRIPASVLLGLFCGVISLYFIRLMASCEGIFGELKKYRYTRLLLGGIILSSLIFFFPVLYGEGYSAINVLLSGRTEADWNVIMNNSLFYGHGNLLMIYVALTVLTKVFATSATNGSGGCGGTFAPSLFIGAFGGFFFSRFWNTNQIGLYLPEKNFTLLGMAGVIAGVMHAPLTGIFLIAEITGGYQLFMPLIIVSLVSVMFISIFEPHSIYAIRLAHQGKLITHHTDRSVLTLMNLNSLIIKDFVKVYPDMTLGDLVKEISKSDTSFMPVTDHSGVLLGEIDITKIRHLMFRTELYQRFTVGKIMTSLTISVREDDPMEEIMAKFDNSSLNFIPVVTLDNIMIGYISRTTVYSMYRKIVSDYSSD